MNDFQSDIGVEGENNLDVMISSLYKRIHEETEQKLEVQLKALGFDTNNHESIAQCEHLQRRHYPHDPQALATYHYKDKLILGVRISDNFMAIEFDMPNLATEGGSN